MNSPDTLDPTLLQMLRDGTETLWLNPRYRLDAKGAELGDVSIADAHARFLRYAPVLARVFPELAAQEGMIESELVEAPALRNALVPDCDAPGDWFIKCDHALPVAGSIKARGAFHEVLSFAERLLAQNFPDDAAPDLDSDMARALFADYTIAVGSTGNLGLGIGTIAAALGFRAVVHMSADAKEWKKTRLRNYGIEVVEHAGDYAKAVEAGRELAVADDYCYFVDDEHSLQLFLGYAVAAQELARQLSAAGRSVDHDNPLFVYLPCGVGGAPGGITYGLKQCFGPHVHCFFAEPVASPCMLVQLASGSNEPLSVYDIGLDNRTEADGLAVGLASPLVTPLTRGMLSGVYTVSDERLFRDVYVLKREEDLLVEPSAAACLAGPSWVLDSDAGLAYQHSQGLHLAMLNATHVLWSTGGSLAPAEEHARFQARGLMLSGLN